MTETGTFESSSKLIVADRVSHFRSMSFTEVSGLPETSDEDLTISSVPCCLTTFIQHLPEGQLLLVLQIAKRSFLGTGSLHYERGLIFSSCGTVVDASPSFLIESGG